MMKKITLLFMALTMGAILHAQVHYSEDFTSQTAGSPPTGFTILNEDACPLKHPSVFTNGSFIVLDSQDPAYGNAAVAQSWTTDTTCSVDDWLITSGIDLSAVTAGTPINLTWESKSNATYLEEFEVRLSTTGTAIADFSTVLLDVTDEPSSWTAHTIDLTAQAGNTVHIAFRLKSHNEDRFYVDNIKVASPLLYDVVIDSSNLLPGIAQPNANANWDYYVIDHSKRTAVTPIVSVKNVGINALDTVIVTAAILNATNTVGFVLTDTVHMSTPLAVGASYLHTFPAQNLTDSFPSLGTSDYLNFIVLADSSSYNYGYNSTTDRASRLVFAPTISYPIPFSSSFEIASGSNFNFDHSTWGWKYLDNDGDGNTLAPHSFSNITMHDGSWGVIGSIVNGTSLSLGADDETLQSPEFTLNAGSTYEFSIYARTWPGQSGSVSMVLTNAAGTNTFIGNVTTAPGDTANFAKHSFQIAAPSAGTDFMVNINKSASGFIILDQFEIVELQAPTAPTVTNTWNACDSTATVNFNIVAGNTYNVDWGDGTTETGVTPPVSHQYSAVGTSYNVAVTASNIIGSANGTTSVTAEAPAAPTAAFTYTANGSNVNFTVTNPNPCSTYEWSFGDNTPNASGTSTQHNYTAAGSYTVTLTETNALGAMPSTQTIVITTSINEIDFVNGINVFPNPANDNVNIAFELNSAQNVEIALVSLDGKVVKTLANSNVTKVNEKLNVANLAKGIYILDITTAEGKFTTNLVVR